MWCIYRLAKSYGWCSVCGCSHDLLSVCPIFLVYLWDELKCARNRSRYPSCGNNKYATVKYHRTVVNSCFLCHVYTFAVIVLNQAVTSSMVAPNVIVMGCHFWNAFIPTYIFNNAMKMIWHYQHFAAMLTGVFVCDFMEPFFQHRLIISRYFFVQTNSNGFVDNGYKKQFNVSVV